MGFSKEVMAGNLRALRARHRVTQREVAEAAGVDVASVANYENEKLPNTPNYETCWRLADFFQVSIDDLGSHKVRDDFAV